MKNDAGVRRARPLLGTLVEISAAGINTDKAMEAAFAEIADIHRLMSFHEAESDVSRLNRAALLEPVAIDFRTYEVMRFAEVLAEESDGAFDITIAGSLAEAGFLPCPDGVAPKPVHTSFRDIALLEDCRARRRNHAWIDLGGVAKGYAVDRAVQTLQSNGITSGVVNAGGDMRIFGEPQPVYLRHPSDPSMLYFIGTFSDSAVASSSGCYSRRCNGTEIIDPLVDPHQGKCVSWKGGVTVIAPTCMAADALTKVAGLAKGDISGVLAAYEAKVMLTDNAGIHILADSAFPINGNAFAVTPVQYLDQENFL